MREDTGPRSTSSHPRHRLLKSPARGPEITKTHFSWDVSQALAADYLYEVASQRPLIMNQDIFRMTRSLLE